MLLLGSITARAYLALRNELGAPAAGPAEVASDPEPIREQWHLLLTPSGTLTVGGLAAAG